VSDINEASVGSISDTNTDTNAVSENAAAGTSVGITALASDGDVTDGVTYSLSDDAGGLFDIDANTGVVTVAGSLDAETATSHTIEVTATSDDGSTSTQSFTIGVNDVNETSISAISDNDGTGNTVTEGASVGTAVGITALASDADVTDTISYSLSSNPGDFFAIDANTGEVTVAGSLDYETDTSHTIDVTATSSDGTTSTQTFTIAVGDEDEFDVGAISDTDGAAIAVDENAAAGTTVGVVALATDADGSNSDVTYSLSDDAGGLFTIDGSTGEVTVADASGIDHEAATSHTIEVTATSQDGSTSTETFSINVSDIDEFDVGAVSDSNATTNGIDEDASVGDLVGITALATDGDVTYALSDDASGLFDIDANTGVVTVAGSLDAETNTSHTIEVTATSDDGSTSTQTFAIGVNDVNETSISAISDNDGSDNTVTEGASVGTAVGITALATDADVTDTISYSLSSNPGGFFAIDANSGEVTATSSDGTTSTQTFTIAVGDEDEHDVSSISDTDISANTVAEDVSNGDSVGITASATDADGSNNTVTYSLSDNAGGIFTIDASTGEVSIADASGIDYENATSHTIEVTATSQDGSTSTQNYTINVTDVLDENPTDISFTNHAEDFEGGATGWSNNTTTDGGNSFSEFLGQFGYQSGLEGTEKAFSTPEDADKTVIKLDVYEINSWDGENLIIEVIPRFLELPRF
jgi:protocadherin Fat 4